MGEKRGSSKPKSRRVFGYPSHRAQTPFRAGLYTRVSTQDQQTIPLQTRALREYATRRGWRIAFQVKEIGIIEPLPRLSLIKPMTVDHHPDPFGEVLNVGEGICIQQQ
jgi:hypothetical protein